VRPLCVSVSEPENGKTTPATESFNSLLARMPLILLDVYETLVSTIRVELRLQLPRIVTSHPIALASFRSVTAGGREKPSPAPTAERHPFV